MNRYEIRPTSFCECVFRRCSGLCEKLENVRNRQPELTSNHLVVHFFSLVAYEQCNNGQIVSPMLDRVKVLFTSDKEDKNFSTDT